MEWDFGALLSKLSEDSSCKQFEGVIGCPVVGKQDQSPSESKIVKIPELLDDYWRCADQSGVMQAEPGSAESAFGVRRSNGPSAATHYQVPAP
jgi:hypothetical protein